MTQSGLISAHMFKAELMWFVKMLSTEWAMKTARNIFPEIWVMESLTPCEMCPWLRVNWVQYRGTRHSDTALYIPVSQNRGKHLNITNKLGHFHKIYSNATLIYSYLLWSYLICSSPTTQTTVTKQLAQIMAFQNALYCIIQCVQCALDTECTAKYAMLW